MKLLILGGTRFLGRTIAEQALAAGHEVTLFNRGMSNPNLFPDAEHLTGDRDGNLTALKGRKWDAVIDPSGYVPRLVRDSARLLADSIEHYTFISSISVYQDFSHIGIDESYPVGTIEDETIEEVNGVTYGPLKALCEQAAESEMPGRVFSVRAGLIVGPHDPTDRFTYWPVRVAQGGDYIAPHAPDVPVQFVDVRDLSAWILAMIAHGKTGTYNATGLNPATTMGALLAACEALSDTDARAVWVDQSFLLENDVQPWSELPVWLPHTDENYRGMSQIDCSKAWRYGLTTRPINQTVRDTLEWAQSRDADYDLRAGLDHDKEQSLLAKWFDRLP